ncbi:MAG: hypothetical protein RL265_482 [Bacteroidota bacterium]
MKNVQLGLKENWKQFTLLVIINGFVGGMIGLERSILPQIATLDFGISANTAILSFIVVFGTVKATTNYFTGALAHLFGKKKLLVIGWIFGIPIPFLLLYAPNWNWIIAANVLLGINQGLTWSTTVMMKIDLVGEKQRGFAMGINEFAGYLSVAFNGMVSWRVRTQTIPFLYRFCTFIFWIIRQYLFGERHESSCAQGSCNKFNFQIKTCFLGNDMET